MTTTRIDVEALRAALDHQGIRLGTFLAARPLTECHAGVHVATGQRVFIKVLHSEVPGVRRNFHREIDVLQVLHGESGVPRLLAASRDPACPFHACERVAAPRLPQGCDSLPDIVLRASALAGWIAGLHARGFAHRDLSPEHVFIDDQLTVTVVDLGMARPCDAEGTDAGYDIQAFGMVVWELISGTSVFPYRSERLAVALAAEIALLRDVELPPGLARLLIRCLCTRSEFTPEGLPPGTWIRSAEELRHAVAELGSPRDRSGR